MNFTILITVYIYKNLPQNKHFLQLLLLVLLFFGFLKESKEIFLFSLEKRTIMLKSSIGITADIELVLIAIL